MFPRLYVEGSIMHNRNYTEQDAIQRLLLFEEGLSGIIGLMKEEKRMFRKMIWTFMSVPYTGCMQKMSQI